LTAVSTNPQSSEVPISISKELVLVLCNNLVIFDAQLDTFRFTHLSVREFLKKRREYTTTATNALVAEACLLTLISMNPNPASKNFLSKAQYRTAESSEIDKFREYSDVYWAAHYRLAAGERSSDKLKSTIQYFVSGSPDCSVVLWNARLPNYLREYSIKWELKRRLEDTEVTLALASALAVVWFVSCAFDLPEIIEGIEDRQNTEAYFANK
jgi:hypothetical protein